VKEIKQLAILCFGGKIFLSKVFRRDCKRSIPMNSEVACACNKEIQEQE
jgi:hypothetical protein